MEVVLLVLVVDVEDDTDELDELDEDEEAVDDAVDELDDELCEAPLIEYTESRLPAPHNCSEFPLQVKLHSLEGAATEPWLKVLPQ